MYELEMGLYDNLDTQTQPILKVDALNDNIIIFGNPLSGKTTFLKTMIVRMHQNFKVDGIRQGIYIIDKNRNLGEYEQLPLVAAYFDTSNGENIRRVFKIINTKLEENIKKLKSKKFSEIYSEAQREKPLHITLIIDNVDSFLADQRYESYFDDLIKFCRDGASKGLNLVFTATEANSKLSRFLNNFREKFVLDVSTDTYTTVLGRITCKPMKIAGRGAAKINGVIREFHIFLPAEDEKAEIREIVQSTFPYKPDKLIGFGDELTQKNFSKYSANYTPIAEIEKDKKVAVGLDYYDHSPIVVNFKEVHSIAIYGKRGWGKSNLLRLIVRGIKKIYKNTEYRFVLLDDGREQLKEFKDDKIKQDTEIHYFTKVKELQDFFNGKSLKQQSLSQNVKPTTPQVKVRSVTSVLQGMDENRPVLSSPDENKKSIKTIFILQSKSLFSKENQEMIRKISTKISETDDIVIYSDVKRFNYIDMDISASLNNNIEIAFLLDNIAEFVMDKGKNSVFGERDIAELKSEYTNCDLGDGYYYDIDRDKLTKMKIIKIDGEDE